MGISIHRLLEVNRTTKGVVIGPTPIDLVHHEGSGPCTLPIALSTDSIDFRKLLGLEHWDVDPAVVAHVNWNHPSLQTLVADLKPLVGPLCKRIAACGNSSFALEDYDDHWKPTGLLEHFERHAVMTRTAIAGEEL
mmetsp:Transcript_159753/g.387921  ORF Transcript_159753/g.387921 Transcript_159753/m.387921 type:complete len:136 (-) Transcript_159753:187-594(-)